MFLQRKEEAVLLFSERNSRTASSGSSFVVLLVLKHTVFLKEAKPRSEQHLVFLNRRKERFLLFLNRRTPVVFFCSSSSKLIVFLQFFRVEEEQHHSSSGSFLSVFSEQTIFSECFFGTNHGTKLALGFS